MLLACGGGGQEAKVLLIPPQQGTTIADTTVKGESHAALWPADGFPGTFENDGVSGAPIEWLLKFPDTRYFGKSRVIIFTGWNTLIWNTVDYTLEKYALFFWGVLGENVYCVGLPPNYEQPAKVHEFNESIKGLCGEERYIDTMALIADHSENFLPGMTTDGTHLSDAAYRKICEEINRREVTKSQ